MLFNLGGKIKELELALKACADKNRLRILKLLTKRKFCVCELAFILEISQPSVSRHLKKLKKAGFILIEQDSFWSNYYLNPTTKCTKQLTALLKSCLGDNQIAKADLGRAKIADREKLCCLRSL